MSLAERLRDALAASEAHPPRLLGDLHELPEAEGDLPAAVLVPIVDRPQPGLLLTRRTEGLRRHAGQVAFPGGRVDPEDDGPIAAALREAEEEIGLDPTHVQIVGIAGRYRTVTGFAVTVVLGVVPPDLAYRPQPAEVAEVFEVPLAHVLAAENQREMSAEWQGATRRYYEIDWAPHRIWGATAAMLVNLSARIGHV